MPISALNVRESPAFQRPTGNRAEEHDGDIRFQTGSRNKALSRACPLKNNAMHIALIYDRIAEISTPYSVGDNGLSCGADTTFHRTYF